LEVAGKILGGQLLSNGKFISAGTENSDTRSILGYSGDTDPQIRL